MSSIAKLGKFEIRRELGKGAMGVVYEGYDPMIDRIVALKTIRAENLQGDDAADQLARFRREAQAAGRLTHPNIVAIYDFGEDAGTYYIAMEYVKGRELKDFLTRNERFAMPDVVRVMTQLLDALDYSHRNGVVHRDIKPSNMILLPDGTVKVADFGIARIESSNLTQTGMILGTPSYMSPEQFMGQTVDGRSDLFSAGVILYQLLTGEQPFTGSVTTIMHKVLQEEPLPPSTLNVQVPRAFDTVIKRALAKRPDDRYQTAREFADALRQAATVSAPGPLDADATVLDVELESTRTGQTTLRQAKPAEATQGAIRAPGRASAATVTSPSPPGSRRSAAAIAGLVASMAVIGAVAWFMSTRSSEPPASAPGVAASPPAPTAPSATAAVAPSAPAPAPSVQAPAGTVVVTALGLADPSDPRYQGNPAALQSDVRADSRSQAVEKAMGLYLQQASLSQHYDRLREKVLTHSGDFIAAVVEESEPRLGKDGLMSVTTQAIVKARDLQKSLNRMSREERIDFIRTNGDPKVAVRVSTRDADHADAPAQVSAIAENILKERIKSFGFRTWSDEGTGGQAADFSVVGEARIKKLSTKLQASGLTITKFTLTSWTVKCVDRATGEEIYFNNTLPKGGGSWATEEEALRAIGDRIAEEFNRDFFLQHFGLSGQKVVLKVSGLEDETAADLFTRELIGLPGVLSTIARGGTSPRVYEVTLAGSGSPQDSVANAILKPINTKLGAMCFTLGASTSDEVGVLLAPACAERATLNRLESAPPAGLYVAPPGRLRSVVKNPETLKKLSI